MSDRLIFVCSHGKDDPERAVVAFTAANTAAIGGQETAVMCTIDGVWLGTRGGTDGLDVEGFTPLSELVADFVANGGEIWLCGTCTRPRKITEDQLIEGAKIVGAARVIEEVTQGAKTITYA